MGYSLDAAAGLGAFLVDLEIPTVLDVRDAVGSLPCVLIPPPTWADWQADGAPLFEWRLVAISSQNAGNLDAWAELDDLVTALSDALPVSRAEPISYALPAAPTPYPAYAVTFSGSY